MLTFSIPHVYKALQMLSKEKYVSRASFCRSLHIGEGAVKTLVAHFKVAKLVDSTRSGTFLTSRGIRFSTRFFQVLPTECKFKKCKILPSMYNHAVLLRDYSSAIKTGVEQRDYAIMYGATSAITTIYHDKKFIFPKEEKDCFADDPKTRNELVKRLDPKEDDVIIITTSDDPFIAEVSAKNAALWTLANHEKH